MFPAKRPTLKVFPLLIFGVAGLRAQMASDFVPVTPCRVVDTRNPAGALAGPSLSALSTRSFPLPAGTCGLPVTAAAYSINVGVLPHGPSLSYLTLWPTGQPMPSVATLASPAGLAVANAAIVPAGTNGAVSVYVTDATDLILDVNGYFITPSVATTQSTAVGTGASSAGAQNTAVGFNALTVNNTGNSNTANGAFALSNNVSGSNNVAVGTTALGFNGTGSANTAVGSQALLNNLIGSDNTALGFNALWENTVGTNNTATGVGALGANEAGSYNTAVGSGALSTNASGLSNIAIGYQAGNLITGSHNIDIGNSGQSSDSNVIRIGDAAEQTSTYIAGVNGVNIISGYSVFINSNGQLGTVQSSRRYKQDIQDMGAASDALLQLRPVTFHYKQSDKNGNSPLQYGLIAEEVQKIYPELVLYDSKGQVESVQYHELPALLLNEVQKQHRAIQLQDAQIAEQQEQIRSLESRIAELDKLIHQIASAANSTH